MIKGLRLILLMFLLVNGIKSQATHIVGGYFSYKCLGTVNAINAEYEVTFKFYGDCSSDTNAVLDRLIPVSIYQTNSTLVRVTLLRVDTFLLGVTDTIPNNTGNPCVVSSPDICVVEGIYRDTILLPRNAGFELVFQRCCRNSIIDNVPSPGGRGSSFSISVPSFNAVGCNSSPSFNKFPPIILCNQFDVNLDLSATDADNDSLVYSFCAPFDYPNRFNPLPTPAFPPPYNELPFAAPQTAANPIPSSPQVSINSQTGIVNGTPTMLGDYVVGFCVEEYRNGVLLSTTRRDIQVSTSNCNPAIINAIQDQTQFCNGFTVAFSNQSSSPDLEELFYFWDFGDPTTSGDTSLEKNPTYTYPDSGDYTITLIVNRGFSCADTSTVNFRVDPLLDPTIGVGGNFCNDQNSVNFGVGGIFGTNSSFEWIFDPQASVASSNQDSVFGVSFPGKGKYGVELRVSQSSCTDTIKDSIEIFNNPLIDFSIDTTSGCYPFPVSFNNLSVTEGSVEYEWDFGEGATSTLINPTHIYNSNGLFDVSLTLRTTDKCIDTLSLVKVNAIDVSLDSSKNKIAFDYFPKVGCPPLLVQFSDSSFTEGEAAYAWDFGTGVGSFEQNPRNTYEDTGYYDIGLILFSTTKCVDTLRLTIDSAIRVLPKPIADLKVSAEALPVKEANFSFDGSGSQFGIESQFLIDGVEVGTDSVLNYSFSDTGRYKVDYVVTNEFECNDTSSQTVLVFDEFEFIVPNVFSPNNDGVNDRFEMRACGVYEYEISIFDRYGLEVFRSNSLNINWDGRVKGEIVSSGVFYYLIRIKDFRGDYLTYQGELTLMRH